MKDMIPLGTGNSRFLKSVENFKALYPTYDAMVAALVAGTLPVDFNGVNPDGVSQIGTALNKLNLLKDATAEMYGLDGSAVPDDVLAEVGKYRLHWWRASSPTVYGYKELRAQASSYTEIMNSSYTKLNYASAISIDQTTGAISLVNPTTLDKSDIKFSWDTGEESVSEYDIEQLDEDMRVISKEIAALAPCYIQLPKYGTDKTWYVPEGLTGGYYGESPALYGEYEESEYEDDYGDTQAWYGGYVKAKLGEVFSERYIVTESGISYVHSNDRNAYPDSGTVDGITYSYLGVPFDNALNPVRVAAGTYRGDNTNSKTLSFAFTPKLLLIAVRAAKSTSIATSGMICILGAYPCGITLSGGNVASVALGISVNGTSVTVTGGSADYACNLSQYPYNYIAIG